MLLAAPALLLPPSAYTPCRSCKGAGRPPARALHLCFYVCRETMRLLLSSSRLLSVSLTLTHACIPRNACHYKQTLAHQSRIHDHGTPGPAAQSELSVCTTAIKHSRIFFFILFSLLIYLAILASAIIVGAFIAVPMFAGIRFLLHHTCCTFV